MANEHHNGFLVNGEQMILIVCGLIKEASGMQSLLKTKNIPSQTLTDLTMLQPDSSKGVYQTIIIDIDSVPVSNRMMREMRRQHPRASFLCVSKSSYHPTLQEAIGQYFYACLLKPVDPDELCYWLNCAHADAKDNRGPPNPSAKRQ
jgi:DNA-binding NtrC family response regulator